MKRVACFVVALTTLLMLLPAQSAVADNAIDAADCRDGLLIPINGSNTCFWVPPERYWNHDLLIFAHGYVDPAIEAGEIPWDQLELISPNLPQLVMSLGYAFAVPSYSKNGLAVVEGVQAVKDVALYAKTSGMGVNNVFLFGASEGGLVAAQAIEQNTAALFKGGVTACGPVGDFRKQVNYWGDFRVLFDYFFPDINVPSMLTVILKLKDAYSPVHIHQAAIDAWKADPSLLKAEIIQALFGNSTTQALALQLMRVSNAPFDPQDPTTIGTTTLGILDYNIRATNEAREALAAPKTIDLFTNAYQPFDNRSRIYLGSSNDVLLNKKVARFDADPAAIEKINALYQTTGNIKAPLVALHNTGDPVVPYWHELLYQLKIWRAGKGSQFANIPVFRYGHCAFTVKEAIFAFVYMVYKATGTIPILPTAVADSNAVLTMEEFKAMELQINQTYLPLMNR